MHEKLIEILSVPFCPHELVDPIEAVADYLIDSGVTIPVRCKDCRKRYNPKECPMCVRVYGEQHDVTNDDGYCDYGERRTDA